jgi:hypothetical protein
MAPLPRLTFHNDLTQRQSAAVPNAEKSTAERASAVGGAAVASAFSAAPPDECASGLGYAEAKLARRERIITAPRRDFVAHPGVRATV